MNNTQTFYSILKKTEECFTFFLPIAIYQTNPITMKKTELILETRQLTDLRCERIFARSNLFEGKSLADRNIFLPAMNRKYVQKPTNISEYLLEILSEKALQVMINFEQRFLALNFEKLACPF